MVFLLQVLQKVDDLGLDGNVQGGHRFIAHDEPGLQDQGPRDADALALTAGKGVGIAAQKGPVQAHLFGDPVHGALDLLSAHAGVVAQGLADDVEHRHPGVQGSVGVLKDHLDIPAGPLHHGAGRLQEVDHPVLPGMKQHLAAGGVDAA